jgi:DNA-binding NarL/FixJ family response regulator
VVAEALGARVRPRAALLTADDALFRRLAAATQEADFVLEMHKETSNVVQLAKEMGSPLGVLVIDARVEADKTMALANTLRTDVRSFNLPIILLAPPDDVEKLRAAGQNQVAGVLPLNADPAQVKIAISNAARSSRPVSAAADVRENVTLVRRILQALATLPPLTRYPAQTLGIAAADFLTNQPNDVRILALRAISNLPHPAVRDPVFEIFVSSAEPAEVRHEAGATLQKLLVVNPRITPQQQAQLRSLTRDADELVRVCAIHGLALADIPQGEREAALTEGAAPAPAAPAAAPKP